MNLQIAQAAFLTLLYIALGADAAGDRQWINVGCCAAATLVAALNLWTWHLRERRIAAQHRIIAAQIDMIEAQGATLRMYRRRDVRPT